MTRIAVLASGTGTNFDAIADAVRGGKLRAEIAGVLSDRPGAFVLAKARECGVPAVAVPKNPAGREAHDADMLRALDQLPGGRPQFLVMAGYMRIVTPALIRAFYDEPRGYSRIVNIHPSLLPAFPGVGGYAQAYAHGAKLAGATIHLVDGRPRLRSDLRAGSFLDRGLPERFGSRNPREKTRAPAIPRHVGLGAGREI